MEFHNLDRICSFMLSKLLIYLVRLVIINYAFQKLLKPRLRMFISTKPLNSKNRFLSCRVKRLFFGRSQFFEMTRISGALDDNWYSGNCLEMDIGEANHTAMISRYVHLGGYEIFEFVSTDIIVGFISLIECHMIPCLIAVGKIYTYLISER